MQALTLISHPPLKNLNTTYVRSGRHQIIVQRPSRRRSASQPPAISWLLSPSLLSKPAIHILFLNNRLPNTAPNPLPHPYHPLHLLSVPPESAELRQPVSWKQQVALRIPNPTEGINALAYLLSTYNLHVVRRRTHKSGQAETGSFPCTSSDLGWKPLP